MPAIRFESDQAKNLSHRRKHRVSFAQASGSAQSAAASAAPVKRQMTARVDADVLQWLKSQGEGYPSRVNAILRRAMLAAHRATGK